MPKNVNNLRRFGTNPARDAMFMQGKPTREEVTQFFDQRIAGQVFPVMQRMEQNILNRLSTFGAAAQIGLQVCQAILLQHGICTQEELDAVTRDYAQRYQEQVKQIQQQNKNMEAYRSNPCEDTISVLTDEQLQELANEYRVSIDPYDRQRVIDTLLKADTSHEAHTDEPADAEADSEEVEASPEAQQAAVDGDTPSDDAPCEVLQFPGVQAE